jgi:hypothetical protein
VSDQESDAPHSPQGFIAGVAHNPIGGFVPWIIFSAIGGPNTWETGAIAALIAAVLLMLFDIGAIGADPATSATSIRRPKLLDLASVIFFGGFVIASFATNRHDVTAIDQYSQVISSGALSLIAFLSVLFGYPFTTDYAREAAPPEVWHTLLFKHINVVLTLVWAIVFGLCAGFGIAAIHATSKGAQDWFNWYLPIILIILGYKANSWYPNLARRQAGIAETA